MLHLYSNKNNTKRGKNRRSLYSGEIDLVSGGVFGELADCTMTLLDGSVVSMTIDDDGEPDDLASFAKANPGANIAPIKEFLKDLNEDRKATLKFADIGSCDMCTLIKAITCKKR